MRAVALLLALLVGAQCAAGQWQGPIRASNQKFVDDNCKEFVPVGMNAYVGWHAHYQICCTCFGEMATEAVSHSYLRLFVSDRRNLSGLQSAHTSVAAADGCYWKL